MTALPAIMLLAATASLVLLGARGRRLAVLPLLGELVMLLAMLDTHVLGAVPPLHWSALLGLCALVTALIERLRRRAVAPTAGHPPTAGDPSAASAPQAAPAPLAFGAPRAGGAAQAVGSVHGDRLHTVGMLIAAGFIAAGATASGAAMPGVHAHGGLGLQAPLLAGVALYAAAAMAGVRGRSTSPRERWRRAASAVALLAMGGMALG